jgi:hypothetical protein
VECYRFFIENWQRHFVLERKMKTYTISDISTHVKQTLLSYTLNYPVNSEKNIFARYAQGINMQHFGQFNTYHVRQSMDAEIELIKILNEELKKVGITSNPDGTFSQKIYDSK